MKKYSLHILYEHGGDLRPYGSAYLRLLRPFGHPLVRERFNVTSGLVLGNEAYDAVIVDRLWHPENIVVQDVKELINHVRKMGAKLIYAIDDNFLDIPTSHPNAPRKHHLQIVKLLLTHAHGVLVTTEFLKTRFKEYNPRIFVIPNMLDERLLVYRPPYDAEPLFEKEKTVIGYMGTMTHDDDLMMILPALEAICKQNRSVKIEILGVAGHESTKKLLKGLPVRFIKPETAEVEYPLFMLWFTGRIRWDIGLAPLQDTAFTRSKSDIKFLDYAAAGVPGIFSRVPAYRDTVRPMETGMLIGNTVENWQKALEELVGNKSLRKKLAGNASRYLYTHRVVGQNTDKWIDPVMKILESM